MDMSFNKQLAFLWELTVLHCLLIYSNIRMKKLKSGKKTVAENFNFTFRYMYIDGVLSINKPKVGDYLDVIYPSELEIKDTTESSNLDLLLNIDKGIVNFQFLSSDIPISPAYGVYFSQLIRYSRASALMKIFLTAFSKVDELGIPSV